MGYVLSITETIKEYCRQEEQTQKATYRAYTHGPIVNTKEAYSRADVYSKAHDKHGEKRKDEC